MTPFSPAPRPRPQDPAPGRTPAMAPDAPTSDFPPLALRLPLPGGAGEAGDGALDRPHVLTVALEDYFQVGAFNPLRAEGPVVPLRVAAGDRAAEKTLALLDAHGAKATFFVLGWIARRFPQLVRTGRRRGARGRHQGLLPPRHPRT